MAINEQDEPIEVEPYQAGHEQEWERFVAECANGSLVNTRRFLDYHGARFEECSLLFREKRRGTLIGLMPIVKSPSDGSLALSHGGASFGGLLTMRPDPQLSAQMLGEAARLLLGAGFKTIQISTQPTIFHRQPDDSELMFLSRSSASSELHLWSVIHLNDRLIVDKKRRATLGSIERHGLSIQVRSDEDDYRRFYAMLEQNLATRHQRAPLHRFEEVLDLRRRLGKDAHLFVACTVDGEFHAGTWIWDYGNGVWHSQYICSTPEGRDLSAVDALLLHCTAQARVAGQRIFSLGRNTLSDGWRINQGLLKFKKRLGCGLAAQYKFNSDLTLLAEHVDSWMAAHRGVPLLGC
jgi:hypothetical protein